ncbi:hypothetical protein F2Q68_00031819 [Brassica cretica]|uniref:Uncharacterized protein n=1 Tax=Brassica cretica TaxID=69181 RepID=A0A8S9GDJ5_BRACR|nr:hypothetical protein F2Q68_00031819 [Brassica cretica]
MIFEVSLSYCLMALPERNINNVRVEQRDNDGLPALLLLWHARDDSAPFRVEKFVNRRSGGSELAGWSSLLIYHDGFCWLVGIVIEKNLVSENLSFPMLLRVLLRPLNKVIFLVALCSLFILCGFCVWKQYKEVNALKRPDEDHRERVVQMKVLLFFMKSYALLSDNHPDGTQRKLFNLQRPQDQQEDRRILRDCKSNVQINRQGTDSNVMFFNEVGPRLGQSEANSFMGSELITNNPCSLQLLRGLACFKRSADKFQWK